MGTHVGYQDPSLFVGLRNSLGFRLRLKTCGPPILGLMSLLQRKSFANTRHSPGIATAQINEQ